MATEPVEFGMIGCGSIANSLAHAIDGVEDATLQACADIVPENARELAAEYDAEVHYEDHETMLAETPPDVAVVTTPNGAHADPVVDCARAGVDVLCQKPLEITVEDIDRMVRACAEEDVALGALMNSRFDHGSQATKAAVEDGALGEVILANATCPVYRDDGYYENWHGTADLDGGCLISQAVHVVDRLAWLMDGIEWVSADLDTVAHDIEVEDVATVQVRYGNGARGTITATTAVREYPHYDRVDLHGTKGHLASTDGEMFAYRGTDREELDAEYPYDRTGFAFQVADMTAAVREGRDPILTGEEARHAPEAILAMHESDRRDERLSVEEFLADHRGAGSV